MNRIFQEYNGRPIRNDDLYYLQNDLIQITQAVGGMLTSGATVPVILSGMLRAGDTIGAGYCIGPDFEIYYHPETTYTAFDPDTFYLDLTSTNEASRTYADGINRYCYISRNVELKTTAAVWTQNVTYTAGFANRISSKFLQILNNKINFDNGDIYPDNGVDLQLNSFYGNVGDTYINRYDGSIHLNDGNPTGKINLNGEVQMVDANETILYNNSFAAGTISIAAEEYDRVIYTVPYTSWTTDFSTDFAFGGYVVSRVQGIIGHSVILPANEIGTITLGAGSATGFRVLAYKFGK